MNKMYVFRFYSHTILYFDYPISFKSRKYDLQKESKGQIISLKKAYYSRSWDQATYFFPKNEDILKKDLLIKIWGFSEKINTHTLETHIYRLKKKLNKIDKNLSLSLRNKNGLYYLKYNS